MAPLSSDSGGPRPAKKIDAGQTLWEIALMPRSCPADTPMGSCRPRCGDSTCEAIATGQGSWLKLDPDTPGYRAGIRWVITAPDGSKGSIREDSHHVIEHADGTITVQPSLVMPSGWHGWLRKGVFTDA